jgi:hypothetical protein
VNKQISIEDYSEHPRINNRNKLTIKIQIPTTNIRHTFESPKMKQWLEDTKIKMYSTTLSTKKLIFAGFFDEPNPEHNKIHFLETRTHK